MALGSPGYEGGPSWSVDDIPYHALAYDQVRDDQRLFHILASASFIEITSDLYTHNLVEFFHDDREVVEWLEGRWEREELQHGAALKRYVQTAWPDFNWEAAYKLFVAEYSQCCTVDRLASTKTLEMAARCVVETGTATFYRMLSDLSQEPVLKRLAAEISADEVRHYKHFYRYFQRYRALEQPSRVAILRTLLNRAAEVEAEDAFYAFKAVFRVCNPDAEFRKSDYAAYRDGAIQLTKSHFPHGMAVKMLLKPLDLNPMVGRAMLPAVTSATRLFLHSWGGRATTKGRSFLSGA
jgi:rubrerythrin